MTCPGSPTAEAGDLKFPQCGFESLLGHNKELEDG